MHDMAEGFLTVITMLFRDRADAGRQLAARLTAYAGRPDLLVFGLPRGGVVVAYEVATVLGAPLDVAMVRKLGVPGHEELALGAIAWNGARVLNDELVKQLRISDAVIERVAAREARELDRRERLYREGRAAIDVRDATVVLVDDGLATGATMRAAIAAVKREMPAELIIAVPVGAAATCEALAPLVDQIVCLYSPHSFSAVGVWYEDFEQTSDRDVRALLERASAPAA